MHMTGRDYERKRYYEREAAALPGHWHYPAPHAQRMRRRWDQQRSHDEQRKNSAQDHGWWTQQAALFAQHAYAAARVFFSRGPRRDVDRRSLRPVFRG